MLRWWIQKNQFVARKRFAGQRYRWRQNCADLVCRLTLQSRGESCLHMFRTQAYRWQSADQSRQTNRTTTAIATLCWTRHQASPMHPRNQGPEEAGLLSSRSPMTGGSRYAQRMLLAAQVRQPSRSPGGLESTTGRFLTSRAMRSAVTRGSRPYRFRSLEHPSCDSPLQARLHHGNVSLLQRLPLHVVLVHRS